MDIHAAVRCNNLEILKEWPCEDLKAAVNECKDSLTPLQIAVKNNNTDMAILLISNGAQVSRDDLSSTDGMKDCSNKSCLQYACDNLNFELVKCLIGGGALQEVNKKEKNCLVDVLMAAIQRNDHDMIRYLAGQGTDLNFSGDNCWGPLVQAINLQNKETATLLLDLGAKPDVLDCNDMNPLHHAVKFKSDTSQSITNKLLEYPSLINAKDEDGCTPLWYAVESNNIKTVEKLLDLGANLEENYDEIDPAELACKIGSKPLVELFLNLGIYLPEKSTPLGYAAVKGDIDCMEMLCNSAYGHAWLHNNADPLYEAITQPSADHANVRYLLRRGISLHEISQDKNPVKAVVENKDDVSLQLLFSFGFDWCQVPVAARSNIEQILVRHRAFTTANLLWKNGYQFQPIEGTRLNVEAYLNRWPRIYVDPIKDDIIKALANLAVLERSVLTLQSLTIVYLRRYLYENNVRPTGSSMHDIVQTLPLPETVQQVICDINHGSHYRTKIDSQLKHEDSGNAGFSEESDDEYEGTSDYEAEFLNSEPFPDHFLTEKPSEENSIDVERFRSFSRKSTKELIGDIDWDTTDDEEVEVTRP